MGVFVKGAAAGRDAAAWTAADRFAAEGVRSYGLTFHALADGRGGGTLAQMALPRGWRAGYARLERDRVAGGPYILAFSATGPYGEELIYRSEIRSPQAAASAELRGVRPARGPREFLAESCDRVAAQFGIRLSGAAQFVGERLGGCCAGSVLDAAGKRAGAEIGGAGIGGSGSEDGAAVSGCLSGMRVYELNDGATVPLMLGVALSIDEVAVRGGVRVPSWRAVDCFCLVTPHDRFERAAATAYAVAAATLRIDPATARLLGRQDADAGNRRSA